MLGPDNRDVDKTLDSGFLGATEATREVAMENWLIGPLQTELAIFIIAALMFRSVLVSAMLTLTLFITLSGIPDALLGVFSESGAGPYTVLILILLILIVLMIVLNFSDVIGLLGSGGLLASLILVILTVVGGYLLGKLGKADAWLQGLGAGQRNIAAAMVVATMNFGNDEVVMVVVYSLIVMVILIPLALELGKRAKAGAAEAS